MDKRWQLTDEPRELSSGVRADTPLVSIAWRALSAEHKARAQEQRERDAETHRVDEALAKIAEQAYRLRQLAQVSSGEAATQAPLVAVAERLYEALRAAGVEIVEPAGETYTGELMDLFENIAQQPEADLTEPRIAEVVKPAITRRGELLRMGKAVIAIPERAPATSSPSPAPQPTTGPPPINFDLAQALEEDVKRE